MEQLFCQASPRAQAETGKNNGCSERSEQPYAETKRAESSALGQVDLEIDVLAALDIDRVALAVERRVDDLDQVLTRLDDQTGMKA